MNAFKSGAVALALAAAVSGCAPMPKIEPVEKSAAVLTGVGDPFQIKVERELTDVNDQVSAASRLPLDLAVRLTNTTIKMRSRRDFLPEIKSWLGA